MSPSTLERKHDAWLEHHARDWVGAGLISESQATAISEYEHIDEPTEPQRLPIVAEVASYLGSVLAIMGGAVCRRTGLERHVRVRSRRDRCRDRPRRIPGRHVDDAGRRSRRRRGWGPTCGCSEPAASR